MDYNMFLLAIFLFALPFIILQLVGMWKVLQKAGQPGWACIVPFYNVYVLLKIAGKPGWWLILWCIPYVNVVFIVWTYNMISKSFGKSEGFTVGLSFLGFVFWPMLGFGKAEYLGPYGDSAAFAMYRQQKEGFDFDKQPGY